MGAGQYDQSGNGANATSALANSFIVSFDYLIGGVPALLSQGGGSLAIPASVSMNSYNYAADILGISTLNSSYVWSSKAAYGPYVTYSTFPTFGNVANTTTDYPQSYAPTVLGIAGTGPADVNGMNDFEAPFTGSGVSQVNWTGGTIGGTTASAQANVAAIFVGRSITAAERFALKMSLYNTFDVRPQVRDLVVATGDSRTLGVNATNQVTYPSQMSKLLTYPANVANTGVGGDTSSGRLSKFWATDALSTAVRGKSCIFALWIGYNDLAVPVSAAQIYTNITTYVGYAHSIGCKVALATESEGVNYAPLSALIRANTAGADTIVDLAADPFWLAGYSTQPANTYPHPTSYGYGFVASDFAAVLNAQPH